MATSPLLGFDEMAVDQANKYLTFNEAAKLLEAVASGRVISRTTTAQPGSPDDGDLYLIPASATGSDWSTFTEGDLALYRGSEWVDITPFEGLGFWVNDENIGVVWDGTDWINGVLSGVITTPLAGEAGAIPFVNGTEDGLETDVTSLSWDGTTLDVGGGIAALHVTLGGVSTAVKWTSGAGSPEGVVTANIGSLYTRTNGGASTTLYVKESGTGNTGWTAK